MEDNRFEPRKIEVRQGETVRLEFVNEGDLYHEAYIGTRAEQDAHEAEMTRPGPTVTEGPPQTSADGSVITAADGHAHTHGPPPAGGDTPDGDDPIVVGPGESRVLEHTFEKEGDIIIGCHETGHYDDGMTITVSVT